MIDFKNNEVIKLRKVTEDSVISCISPLLLKTESIIGTYKAIRDFVVFTDKRMITVNVQGVTGKKKDFTTIPYSKIQTFSVETSGHFDMESELELWISGLGKICLEFAGSSDILEIGRMIGECCL